MNINNQTEYKKPLGTRLFILIAVCMIVVAMAVPAFAASYDSLDFIYLDSVVKIYSEGNSIYCQYSGQEPFLLVSSVPEANVLVWKYNGGGNDVYRVTLYPLGFVPYVSSDGKALDLMTITGSFYSVPFVYFVWDTSYENNVRVVQNSSYTSVNAWDVDIGTDLSGHPYTLLYSTTDIFSSSSLDEVYFAGTFPPPPDIGQEVTVVLPTVLSWIQQTLNALFVEGGALQGLLLLVAVPVAITLLLLGARFIRSVIWGA